MIKTVFKIIIRVFLCFLLLAVVGSVYLFSYNLAEPKAGDYFTTRFSIRKLPFDHNKVTYGHDNVVLVVVDAKSAEKYRWPWKRELYCDILEYFSKYASEKVIVDDSILITLDKDNPQSDAKYFDAIKKISNYATGFMQEYRAWQDEEAGARYDTEFSERFSLKSVEDNIPLFELYKSMIKMPKQYRDAVKNIGSVALLNSPISGSILFKDDVVRTQSHFIKYKGSYYPSLAMKTFLMLNDVDKIVLSRNYIEFPEQNYKIRHYNNLFQTVVPLKFYKMRGDTGYSHIKYSAVDIMESLEQIKNGKKPLLSPELFKDKIVVLGANVPAGTGLNDNKNSPILANHPGVDIQATAIDNIVNNDFLNVIPQSVNFLITLFGMLIVYLAIRLCNLSKSIMAVTSLFLGYLFISATCFYFNVVVNVITPLVMFTMMTIFAYTHKYVIENRNKEKVKSAMGKYMSNDVMQNVVKNIDNLGLGGKKSIVTVLFADIRGFTSMSEKMSAQQVSEILNEYFSEMEPIITKYNGIINKFIGDAIMAVFGEPIQDEKHAQNAVKCAYEMLNRVRKLHKKWSREGKPEIEIGIGINTGEVFIGNIGSVNRMEYTVIGDTVNLASRLESYNKIYQTKMLISASTYKEVRTFVDVIKIPEVQIRGKANKIDIYEVLKVKLD